MVGVPQERCFGLDLNQTHANIYIRNAVLCFISDWKNGCAVVGKGLILPIPGGIILFELRSPLLA